MVGGVEFAGRGCLGALKWTDAVFGAVGVVESLRLVVRVGL